MDFNSGGKKRQRGNGIVKISDLFKKYRDTLSAPQGVVVNAFIVVIEERFGVALRKDQCTYSVASKTLTVRISGMVKTEILLQKQSILKKLVEILGAKSAPKEIL